jgi:hypothetical protein
VVAEEEQTHQHGDLVEDPGHDQEAVEVGIPLLKRLVVVVVAQIHHLLLVAVEEAA